METAKSAVTTEAIIAIAAILLASGVVGGLCNFVNGDKGGWRPLCGAVLMAISAAFSVPLFLNMISSDLITTADTRKYNYLIIGSFGIVAAIFSREFLQRVYDAISKKVEEVSKKADDAKKKADDANNKADDANRKVEVVQEEVSVAREANTEPEPREETMALERDLSIADEDMKILRAMEKSRFPYRSLSGIRNDTGIEQQEINTRLSRLINSGLVAQTESKAGQPRWYLTVKGRQAVLPLDNG